MDCFLPTTLAFLGAVVASIYVGKHAVRKSLRDWCNTQLEELEGNDSRHADGRRTAIRDLQSGLKRRWIEFEVRNEGEI